MMDHVYEIIAAALDGNHADVRKYTFMLSNMLARGNHAAKLQAERLMELWRKDADRIMATAESNGYVSILPDESGNGNDLVQPDPAKQPGYAYKARPNASREIL